MIKAVSEGSDFAAQVTAAAPANPFACRILSLYQSYRPGLVFVDYWLVTDENGKTTGAIARNGSDFILLLTKETDTEEVSAFMRVAGASAILCSGDYSLELPSFRSVTGAVLMRDRPYGTAASCTDLTESDIRAAYDLIARCTDEDFCPPSFEDFYVDVNHKLRHQTMRMSGIFADGSLACVAMTVAESRDAAVLGAVACDPAYRRMGYGSQVVTHLANALIGEGKKVFLHRAKNRNIGFYSGMGFCETGTWREYF